MLPAIAIAKSLDMRTIGVGLGLAAGAALVVYLMLRNAGKIGETVGRAAGDVVSGTVLGLGDAVGVPRTNMTECERAIAEGRTWDASFACPAGTFIGSLFGQKPSSPTSQQAPVWTDDYGPYLGRGA